MLIRLGLLSSFGLLGLACASSKPPAKTPEDEAPPAEQAEEKKPEAKEAPATVAPDEVEKAARPFYGIAAASGAKMTDEVLLTRLASADVVCFGESHDSVSDHYGELAVLRGLLERRAMRGFELGLAMEMVNIPYQPALDHFAMGRLTVASLETETHWAEEWGFPFGYYAPLFEESRVQGAVIPFALGLPKKITNTIAEKGLAGLPEDMKRSIPEIDRSNVAHRELFDSLMEGHPAGDPENMYEAQLAWDEEMAERSAKFVSERAPGRKLLIVAGSAHCHQTALPSRIQRRATVNAVSIIHTTSANAAEIPEKLRAGYDYYFVMEE